MDTAIKHVLTSVLFAVVALASACDSNSTAPASAADAAVDAVVPGSAYVPIALENVIDSMVAAINAKNLAPAEKPPVAVLLKTLTDYFAPVVIGANRMSTRLVCPSVVEAPLISTATNTAALKAAEQNKYMQNYLDHATAASHYQALGIAPYSTDDTSVQYINSFVETLGPVVTIDSDSPASKRSYFIATDNYQAGIAAANTLRTALNPGDTVAVFGTTDPNWVSGLLRAQGAEDGLAAAGLLVAPRIPTTWNNATDLAALQAALSDPALNLKGLLCVYADANLCAAAVEALGMQGTIQIVGFDMAATTKAYFDQGYFHALMVQRQYYMGQFAVLIPYAIDVLGPELTAQLLAPALVNTFAVDTGVDVITRETYADYNAYLSSLGINNQ